MTRKALVGLDSSTPQTRYLSHGQGKPVNWVEILKRGRKVNPGQLVTDAAIAADIQGLPPRIRVKRFPISPVVRPVKRHPRVPQPVNGRRPKEPVVLGQRQEQNNRIIPSERTVQSMQFVLKNGLTPSSDPLKPYKCILCVPERGFRNKNGLKYHATYKHGPNHMYICRLCDRIYKTRVSFTSHRRRAHGYRDEPIIINL